MAVLKSFVLLSIPVDRGFCSWNSPSKDTGVGSHSHPSQGIFPILGSPTLQADYLPSEPSGKPIIINKLYYFKSDYFETFLKLHFHFIYLKCNRGSQKNVIHYYLESLCKFLWTFRFFSVNHSWFMNNK